MVITEAIILAGGLGTRLRTAVPELPKCMAPVNGVPFIDYVVNDLLEQGISHFIFSLGYKSEVIIEHLQHQFPHLSMQLSVEEEPLGTGGAIQLACKLATQPSVLIANGDTLFKINLAELAGWHSSSEADCTLGLKKMTHFNRYGVVEIDSEKRIISFSEKKYYDKGLINGGIYLLDVPHFLSENLQAKFSFEKDYLEALYTQRRMIGVQQDAYFIDIGIPEDYKRAQTELQTKPDIFAAIDDSWTLFIDRDGVINHEIQERYVLHVGEFNFMPGVKEAFATLSNIFKTIIVVTNQRGIGKLLMTENDLADIHTHMLYEINKAGGRIDKIYYCTSMDNDCYDRKPNPGMAFMAQKDHPAIDLKKSIMIGNKLSDMQFGRNAGMFTIFVATTNPEVAYPHPLIDYRFNNMPEAAAAIASALMKS